MDFIVLGESLVWIVWMIQLVLKWIPQYRGSLVLWSSSVRTLQVLQVYTMHRATVQLCNSVLCTAVTVCSALFIVVQELCKCVCAELLESIGDSDTFCRFLSERCQFSSLIQITMRNTELKANKIWKYHKYNVKATK